MVMLVIVANMHLEKMYTLKMHKMKEHTIK